MHVRTLPGDPAVGGAFRARELAREQPVGEREERQEAESGLPGGREDIALDRTAQQVVLVLRAHEAGDSEPAGCRLGRSDLVGIEVRVADRDHLALHDELVERAESLLDRHRRVGGVLLVEVDAVGAEPPERSLDGGTDVGE
ncbi:hypothetical protein GCM10025881_04940 [Pseudolysinimonas kribbensis]|uniref:Asp23/Gls24 family envelope stress response protein n=1 Tax=Pseudolysinimonas kribbensis TaxID=433641 RepID=A0ABQ6K3K6_9MICO|nr:hypothetical protein GCM10025881_04940 [Pseudolysinimonas kribbensis]